MHFTTLLGQAALIASLTASVLANPTTLYRGDQRKPADIKAAGGFKARGYDRTPKQVHSKENLLKHVHHKFNPPFADFYVSTTTERSVAEGHAGNYFLYTLDPSKITEPIHECAVELAGTVTGHEKEKEWTVEYIVPWAAVTKVEKKKDGKWTPLVMPKKRSMRIPVEADEDGDVFEDAVEYL